LRALRDVIDHGRCLPVQDTIETYDCLVHVLTLQFQFDEVLSICLSLLDTIGVSFPKRNQQVHMLGAIVKLKKQMKEKDDPELLNLPKMVNSEMIFASRILSRIARVTSLTNLPKAHALAAIKDMQMSWKYGTFDQTAELYANCAMLFAHAGDLSQALRIGRIGTQHATTRDRPTIHDGLAIFVVHNSVHHLRYPYRESLGPMLAARQIMTDCGEYQRAIEPLFAYDIISYCCGIPLGQLATNLDKSNEIIFDYANEDFHLIRPLQQMISTFMGLTEGTLVLSGEDEPTDPRSMIEHTRYRMILAYYFHDLEEAEAMSKRIPFLVERGAVPPILPIQYFVQPTLPTWHSPGRPTRSAST